MTSVAFLLILSAAVCHATWNFLLKRSEHKTAFLGLAGMIGAATLIVPAAIAASSGGIGARGFMFGCVTACLHGAYGLALARGYQVGDLSTVYPVARGVGLALIPIGAAILLDESVSVVAAIGIATVFVGVYLIHIDGDRVRDLGAPLRALGSPASRIAVLTGLLITMYYLWDKNALDEELSPITLNQFAMTGHALITTTVAVSTNRQGVLAEWRDRRWALLTAGVLIQVSYLLALAALETSQVSYIAPSREVAIVFGAALGVLFLGEGFGLWRIWASMLIVAGVLTLAVAP